MKAIIAVVFSIFICISEGNNVQQTQEKIKYSGTFIGLTEDYLFEFKDSEGKSTIFNEIHEDVEINLYDDENISKKFELTWEKYKIELTDDEGDSTGEFEEGKRILSLKELK